MRDVGACVVVPPAAAVAADPDGPPARTQDVAMTVVVVLIVLSVLMMIYLLCLDRRSLLGRVELVEWIEAVPSPAYVDVPAVARVSVLGHAG